MRGGPGTGTGAGTDSYRPGGLTSIDRLLSGALDPETYGPLQPVLVRGTIGTEGGELDGGQKNFLGRFKRGRTGENLGGSGISEETQTKYRGWQTKTSQITKTIGNTRAEFQSIREEYLTPKQRREIAIAKEYGYDLYHIPGGPPPRPHRPMNPPPYASP